jgi:hypothetical protein
MNGRNLVHIKVLNYMDVIVKMVRKHTEKLNAKV